VPGGGSACALGRGLAAKAKGRLNGKKPLALHQAGGLVRALAGGWRRAAVGFVPPIIHLRARRLLLCGRPWQLGRASTAGEGPFL